MPPVFRCSQDQVAQIRTALDQAVEDINRQDLQYEAVNLFSESQNSNSVYRTLMDVADEIRRRRRRVGLERLAIP